MSCLYPLKGYYSKIVNPSGKRSITFKPGLAYDFREPLQIPCGRCVDCRLKKSREQAIRCVHEASLYTHNVYVTLTYNDDHLPRDESINLRHIQLFMKRLRKSLSGQKIRSYGAGEYGMVYGPDEKPLKGCFDFSRKRFVPFSDLPTSRRPYAKTLLGRPHYHLLLFNCNLGDLKYWTTIRGKKYYRSEELEAHWTDPDTDQSMGYSLISDVTIESAAYVARYCAKKFTNKAEHVITEHYRKLNRYNEVVEVNPERALAVSKGLGRDWLEKYTDDVYPHDEIIHKARKFKPPRYYDYRHAMKNPEEMEFIKQKRVEEAKKALLRPQPPLKSKIINKLAKVNKLKRGLEDVA